MSGKFQCRLSGGIELGEAHIQLSTVLSNSIKDLSFEGTLEKEITLSKLVKDLLSLLQLDTLVEPPDLQMNQVTLKLNSGTKEVEFLAHFGHGGVASFVSKKVDDTVRGYIFSLGDFEIDLRHLPLVGDHLEESLTLSDILIVGSSAEFKNPPLPDEYGLKKDFVLYPGLGLMGNLTFKEYKHTLQLLPTPETDSDQGQGGSEKEANYEATGQTQKGTSELKNISAIKGTEEDKEQVKWKEINKKLGPLHLQKIGVRLQLGKKKVGFLLDAGIHISGLQIDLDGLGVEAELTNLKHPKFKLRGLGIHFKAGQLEIGGSFLKTTDVKYNTYSGSAIVKMTSFSISAIGSYSTPKDPNSTEKTSLFLFGMINVPIGGPPAFNVEGIALGFGYNRKFTLPKLDQVKKFPLVAGVLGTGVINENSQPNEVLEEIGSYLAPASGQYWLACGLRFTSFETIDVFALLNVSFGAKFEVNLLGLGTVQVPTKVNNPSFRAELALIVSFVPADGFVGVKGGLTSASYILSKDCHITGGFAFYLWFAGEHKGDFLVSLGGYHKDFNKPAHYPTLQELGLNWKVTSHLHIKGGGYFALTPSCIMAGGHLDATYQRGELHAGFSAFAHFLMQWHPFHYDIHIGINVGVSYTAKVTVGAWKLKKTIKQTFSTHVNASLHLWGPDFSGTAKVHWTIISFSIDFGAGSSAPQNLSWDQFADAFLPSSKKTTQIDSCTIRVQDGLLKEVEDPDGKTRWLIKSDELVVNTSSAIPITETEFNTQGIDLSNYPIDQLGILPMGKEKLRHFYKVMVKKADGTLVDSKHFSYDVIAENVPEALWGKQRSSKPEAKLIKNVPVGISIKTQPGKITDTLPELDLEKVGFENHWVYFPIPSMQDISELNSSTVESIGEIKQTVMADETVNLRKQVLRSLQEFGVREDVSLDDLAHSADELFIGEPQLVDLPGISKAKG